MNVTHRLFVSLLVLLGSAVAQDPVTQKPVARDPARLDALRITSGEFAAERFGPARWLDGAHYATLEPK
ncbi:MAG: hypothetical protein KDC48_16320, partial [Planctomycetes bacterium]|nr:hypothetical protein [Planctomycetota bacterium]